MLKHQLWSKENMSYEQNDKHEASMNSHFLSRVKFILLMIVDKMFAIITLLFAMCNSDW